jgi:hypothetical protein
MVQVTRHTSHVTRHTSHVTRHSPPLGDDPTRSSGARAAAAASWGDIHYTSHVTRHTAHVTRHTSHVRRNISQRQPQYNMKCVTRPDNVTHFICVSSTQTNTQHNTHAHAHTRTRTHTHTHTHTRTHTHQKLLATSIHSGNNADASPCTGNNSSKPPALNHMRRVTRDVQGCPLAIIITITRHPAHAQTHNPLPCPHTPHSSQAPCRIRPHCNRKPVVNGSA